MATSRAEAGTLIVAVLALAFSGFTWWKSDQAEQRTERRIDRQEKQQVASKVYLGEAPKYAYQEFQEDGTRVRWVVINYSPVQVVDVWVKGANEKSIIIDRVQACTLYGLPYGFTPEILYFKDIYGQWHVPVGGLPAEDGKAPPKRDTDNSDEWTDVRNCP